MSYKSEKLETVISELQEVETTLTLILLVLQRIPQLPTELFDLAIKMKVEAGDLQDKLGQLIPTPKKEVASEEGNLFVENTGTESD